MPAPQDDRSLLAALPLATDLPTADLTEHTLNSRKVYDGGLLKVMRDEVRLPDGNTAWREYVLHPGAVMVLALFDDGTLLLERQYRYPPRAHYIELPAGKLEPGEPALVTAKRELIEECGFEARDWQYLAALHPTIGYSNEVIELYVARGLTQVAQQLDEGEFLQVLRVPMKQALAWVQDGTICDGKTAFALMWAALFGGAMFGNALSEART
jgi:ADP-ribose pyrophosphatase